MKLRRKVNSLFTSMLLYRCSAVLLCCCTAVSLCCYIAVLLYRSLNTEAHPALVLRSESENAWNGRDAIVE
jgi:hypothetical protein